MHEALELRDLDKNVHHGKGVLRAVANINAKIGPAIVSKVSFPCWANNMYPLKKRAKKTGVEILDYYVLF